MLNTPIIRARPGEGDTPGGACIFTSTSSPADGPYALTGDGRWVSYSSIRLIGRALGFLLTDDAQAVFERLVREHAELRVSHDSTVERQAELDQERVALNARIGELEAEIAELHVERDREKTLAMVAAEWIDANTPPVKASKQGEPSKAGKRA